MVKKNSLKKAIKIVLKELKSLSLEEFRIELEKHKKGPYAKILRESWKIVYEEEKLGPKK
jgi:hypothetical protein